MERIRTRMHWLGGAMALLALVSAEGCGNLGKPPTADNAEGSVGLYLQLAPGLKLDAVNYDISHPSGFSKTGVLHLSGSNTLGAQIGGLPAAADYTIALSGLAGDGKTTCGGSATFAITAGMSTSVTVHLLCKQKGGTGTVVVGATLNVCPVIDALSATPTEVVVGKSVQLEAAASDADSAPSPLAYSWTADLGSLSASNVTNPVFTCTSYGPATLALSVSDGDPSADCAATATLTVMCSAPSAYLVPTAPGVVVKDILTVGQIVNGYRMAGIPDGLGAFDNGDGSFTLLVDHELGNTSGVTRAHGGKGTFVSKWIIRTSDLAPLSGQDLIKQIALWNPTTASYAAPATGISLSRLCSADLAPISAWYDAASGMGFDGRLFTSGEETGNEGRAFAHGMDGTSWELPRLGKLSFENVVAHPGLGRKTLVAELDDSTPGQVYFYLGAKTSAGTPIEKAGLTNGTLLGVKVNGVDTEDNAAGIPSGTAFTLVDLGNWENGSGAALDTASTAAGVTRFLRPEDGVWDPVHTSDFYFVTTNGFSKPSRLWRLHFADVSDPASGGTIDMLLDGTEGQHMFDNITIDRAGHVYLQEDVGNHAHLGKVWRYDVVNDTLTQIAQHDPLRFLSGAPLYLTQDEESSGMLDASSILGPGWFLLDVQAHYPTDAETVEGGQLLALYDPTWGTDLAKVDVAVIGDTPYGATQIADFPNLIADINAAPGVARVIHVGDIKSGSTRCDDSHFALVLAGFQSLQDPMIYTPGDNEWTDCHRANNGGYPPLERLSVIRSMFFPNVGRSLGMGKKDLLSQAEIPGFEPFVENTLWSEAGTVFATLHVVGSNNSLLPWYTDDPAKIDDPASREAEESAREAAAVAWIEQAFAQATQQSAKAVALFMQADMWDPEILASGGHYSGFVSIVRKLAEAARAFARPVLLVEGDSHVFKVDNPLATGDANYGVATAVPNLTRIVVQGSTTAPLTEWLRLKVDPSTPTVFSWERNPR